MMLARLFARIRGMRQLHVFLLEIVAVFIGITASLLVDNWRQARQDRDVLDHLLQATHYNALQLSGYIDQVYEAELAAIKSATLLMYGDVAAIPDAQLVREFELAAAEYTLPAGQPGYQRLLNSPPSIPFDHTMAELDYVFTQLLIDTAVLGRLQQQVYDLRRDLRRAAGLPEDPRSWSMDLVDEPAQKLNAINAVLLPTPGYAAEVDDAAAIRAALGRPEVRAMLRDLIGLRYRSSTQAIRWENWNDQVIATIRRYDPAIPLPIGVVELSGDATTAGWSGGLPMERDRRDPNVWHLRVELTDGQVKFRADNSFASNWGAPTVTENRAATIGYEFGGDGAAVFPEGVAEFGGLNIPVRAGTWDVSFNTQTFAYAFSPVSAQAPDREP